MAAVAAVAAAAAQTASNYSGVFDLPVEWLAAAAAADGATADGATADGPTADGPTTKEHRQFKDNSNAIEPEQAAFCLAARHTARR